MGGMAAWCESLHPAESFFARFLGLLCFTSLQVGLERERGSHRCPRHTAAVLHPAWRGVTSRGRARALRSIARSSRMGRRAAGTGLCLREVWKWRLCLSVQTAAAALQNGDASKNPVSRSLPLPSAFQLGNR